MERSRGLGRILLAPAAGIYYLVVRIRHVLYDTKVFKSYKPAISTICVGNLTVGGTGKTPHIELLIQLLSKKYKLAVLSRGYKRKSRGAREIAASDDAANAGDEPLQIKQKFPHIPVFVNANRVQGVEEIKQAYPATDLVLLDDAFQHRKIKSGFNILLVDYNRPIWEDCMLPIGNLRDTVNQAIRANVVIVTKCPNNISPIEKRIISKKLRLYPYQTLLFSHVEYDYPKPLFATANPFKIEQETIVVAGIASPQPFVNHIKLMNTKVNPIIFSDHHNFTEKDINDIADKFRKLHSSCNIVTTEKDAKRLLSMDIPEDVKNYLYFVPIKAKLSDNTDDVLFNKIIRYVKENPNHSGLH